jgi:uncharacterized membrane protein
MALFEEYGIEFFARYAHILSGITWIGLLYYFNFVQTPAFAGFEAPARNESFAKLVPRALWWFRWAAASTLAFGLLLFALYSGGDFAPYEEMKQINVLGILAGMAFGITMFLNVWLVIWPNQKIVIANAEGVLAGREADPAAAAAARKGACASRTNTLLSLPMLFFMVAAGHLLNPADFDTSSGGSRGIWYLVIVAIIALAEVNALRAPAAGKPEAWYIDDHKNTIIAGAVLTVVLYLLVEILFG